MLVVRHHSLCHIVPTHLAGSLFAILSLYIVGEQHIGRSNLLDELLVVSHIETFWRHGCLKKSWTHVNPLIDFSIEKNVSESVCPCKSRGCNSVRHWLLSMMARGVMILHLNWFGAQGSGSINSHHNDHIGRVSADGILEVTPSSSSF